MPYQIIHVLLLHLHQLIIQQTVIRIPFKNGVPASPAIAFANNVLPVPGGPPNNTPLGTPAPNFEK